MAIVFINKKPGRLLLPGLENGWLFGNQLRKITHSAHQLTYIAHFIVVPTYGPHHLVITYCLNLGLGCIEQ
jgi:hypothetical protein